MKIAIIGGRAASCLLKEGYKSHTVPTTYGCVELYELADYYLILRHLRETSVLPHQINYQANIEALKVMGITKAIGIYSVGSITEKIKPGEIGLVNQFIDFTNRVEQSTFNTKENRVGHVSMSHPYSKRINKALLEGASKVNVDMKEGGTYICTNGPRLETAAEIEAFKRMGADYVGMTGATEAILANEIELEFASIAYSVNWAAGIKEGEITFISDKKVNYMITQIERLIISANLNGL
ncbi:MAG: MTAP family purine nucleoside phosphorylase [Sphaerochaetaceae bacterium]